MSFTNDYLPNSLILLLSFFVGVGVCNCTSMCVYVRVCLHDIIVLC